MHKRFAVCALVTGMLALALSCTATPSPTYATQWTNDAQRRCLSLWLSDPPFTLDRQLVPFDKLGRCMDRYPEPAVYLIADDDLSDYIEPDPERGPVYDHLSAYHRTFVACQSCGIPDMGLVFTPWMGVSNKVWVYQNPEKAHLAYQKYPVDTFLRSALGTVPGTEWGACAIGDESCIWYHTGQERTVWDDDEQTLVAYTPVKVKALFRSSNVLSLIHLRVNSYGDIEEARQLALDLASLSHQIVSASISLWPEPGT